MNKKNWFKGLFFALILVGISSKDALTEQKKIEAFYKGATLNFVVPYGPGGGYDMWPRVLAPHLRKYTGTRMVLIQNMPGAGGMLGGGYLYGLAKPDGLTIGILPMPGMVVGEMLEFEQVKYELGKFAYIGRVEVMDRALVASKASGFKSIADLQNATKTIRFGTIDPTATSSVDEAIIAEAFGLKGKIIPGYKGSQDYLLATIAGREVDVSSTPLASAEEYVKKGDLTLVAMMGKKRHPSFPGVPTLIETSGLKPEGKKLLELLVVLIETSRMIVAPPGVPEQKRLFLEKALLASMKEPSIVNWAQKGQYNISPLPGKESKELVVRLMESIPKAERPKLKNIISEKYY